MSNPGAREADGAAGWMLRRCAPRNDDGAVDTTASSLRASAKQSRTTPVKEPAVYIMASGRNGTLYTGVTSDLVTRVWQHKEGTVGFTSRYGCKRLVWFEQHGEMLGAIAREKQIKAGSRKRKLALIEGMNPAWNDLYDSVVY